MASTATDRLYGANSSLAVKAPCKTVSTSNITLSGTQTITGVAVTSGDRVLVAGQDTASENGIYIVATGNWSRAPDFDGNRDVQQGTLVVVYGGSTTGAMYQVTTADPITIGTSAIAFTLKAAPNITYDQTQAEIDAGVTPTYYSYAELSLYRYGINAAPGTTDMTTALSSAISVASQKGGGYVELPGESIAWDGTLALSRYVRLRGQADATVLVPLSASAKIYLSSSQAGLEDLNIEAASVLAGSIGVHIGTPTAFTSFHLLSNVTIKNFEQNVLFDNTYFVAFNNVNIDGGTYGITYNPTAGTSLGFNTTISLRKVYVHNMTYNGIRDLSSTNSLQNSFRDVVVEECGDSTHPQVDLAASQSLSWNGGYIESQAGTPPKAVSVVDGHLRDMYINGASVGVDGGSGSSRVFLDDVQFVSTTTSVSATGAANAYWHFKDVNFDTAPSITAASVVYDNCTGTLPTNISTNALEIAGSSPKFGIGALASSKIDSIRYYSFTESVTAAANTTTSGTGQSVATGALSNAVVLSFPTSALPTGVTFHAEKTSANGFQHVYANVTGTGQSVTNTFLCAIIKFAS